MKNLEIKQKIIQEIITKIILVQEKNYIKLIKILLNQNENIDTGNQKMI